MFVLSYLLNADKITLISSNKYNYEEGRTDSLTKKINSYESELAGKEEFDRIVTQLINELNLDNLSIKELEVSQRLYIEPTLISIKRFPKRSQRISRLKYLDLTTYHNYKKVYSRTDKLLFYFYKHRMFFLYDVLINLKK